MQCMVVLSFFLQLLLCAQVHLCQKTKKIAKAAKDTEKIVVKGFAPPVCCEFPWKFDSGTGHCILDMMAQGVKKQDMTSLCTAVGFELEDGNCIRYVRLCNRIY